MEKEFTQVRLYELLGLWKYQKGSTVKYYQVKPTGSGDTGFEVRWGTSLGDLVGKTNRIVLSNGSYEAIAEECYRRILSKARGGYTQMKGIPEGERNTPSYYQVNSISEVLEYERQEASKRKPRKRKLSLLEWVGGAEEIREDENF